MALFIDLRSDTVTLPTQPMRQAMAQADVGDDVYGEDRTVRTLEERVAHLLGHEDGIFVPSGTMGNQLAMFIHCRPGDEVIVGEGAHPIWYESGAAAAIAGVQFAVAGTGGFFNAEELEAAKKPDAYYCPRTSLMSCEDTHNRAGGRVWPIGLLREVVEKARSLSLLTHLDGARLFNASIAHGTALHERSSLFDSVTVCLSKGLGAPVGSVLCSSRPFIQEARRRRKMLGAGMRQVGILAAGGLYALEHHVDRLSEDHGHAQLLAQKLCEMGQGLLHIDLPAVETNIVNVDVHASAEQVVKRAKQEGVLINAFGPKRLRLVTHLDIGRNDVIRAAQILASVLSSFRKERVSP